MRFSLIEQQAAQLADLGQLRGALQQRVQTQGQQIADGDARLHAQATAATAEREAHRAHTGLTPPRKPATKRSTASPAKKPGVRS